jgi:cyclopropane fatty-acyl-phospholipid synthase-like methyltransferase
MTTVPSPGRYTWLEFNAPLSSARADALAHSLGAARPSTIMDIGCGWAELLLRVLTAAPRATGWGIDIDARLLARARQNANARALADRVTFVEAPVPREHEPADVVICIGADHAYGSQSDALHTLSRLVRPGGQLLFGSGFWEREPSHEQAAAIGMKRDSLTDLAGLVDLAIAAGFRPLRIETANCDEWEAFESGYLADWEHWLHQYPNHNDVAEVRTKADAHRNAWLRGYRDVLGFAYLTLGRTAG